MNEKTKRDIEEGKLRAAVVRASNGPEVAARVDAFVASVPDLLSRAYVGPDNGKGRQPLWIAPKGHPGLSPQQFNDGGI